MQEINENGYLEEDEIFEEIQDEETPEEESREEVFFPEEVEVIGVRFKRTGKIYYFDPCGKQMGKGKGSPESGLLCQGAEALPLTSF